LSRRTMHLRSLLGSPRVLGREQRVDGRVRRPVGRTGCNGACSLQATCVVGTGGVFGGVPVKHEGGA
jgi:hypothetical protein